MHRRFILSIWLLAFSSSLLFAQTQLQRDALQDLKQRITAQEAQWHGPAFQQLKAMQSGPMGILNRDQDIELVGVDETGHMRFLETHNLVSAQTVSADECWPGGNSGYDITGSGAHLGEVCVWDAGSIRSTHVEFGNRVWIMDNSDMHYHATHVGGTIAASGLNNAAKGLSFGIDYLFSYDWDSAESEMIDAAQTYSMHVSNHSYGYIAGWRYQSDDNAWYWYGNVNVSETEDYGFGFYDDRAEAWDEICYNAPYYTICKSAGNDRGDGPGAGTGHYAEINGDWEWSTTTRERDGGNDGYDCIGYNGNAKNIITVGAVDDVPGGYSTPGGVTMSSFSGWGPTDDGRIKPDIVANGINLYSTYSSGDNEYTSMSGTSMSSPSATGAVNLLLQYYKSTHVGQAPRAATIKGLIIQTADECGNYDGPDYRFGWGLINVEHAADIITADAADGFSIQENVLDDGEIWNVTYTSTGDDPIALTICWTDVPGNSPAPVLNDTTRMLVNDLDIRIENTSTGTEYFPWILDPASPTSAASTGDNYRDNVEKIYIENPQAGDYLVTVSHKGTLETGSQAYSLIVSGLEWTEDPRIPPSNLAAEVDYANGEVTLSWDMEELNDFLNFRVYRNLEDVGDSDDNEFTDRLEDFGTYTYQVTSIWDEGESTASNEVTVNYAEPIAPTAIHVTWNEETPGELTLSWQHMELEELSYDDGSSEDPVSFVTTSPAGSFFTERYTATIPGPLAEIGAYLGAHEVNGFGPVRFIVFAEGETEERGGDTLFISDSFTPDTEDWYWMNIIDEGIVLEEGEDYWVAVSWDSPGYTVLGRDTSSPDRGRGMVVGNNVWLQLPSMWAGNLMIRSRIGQPHEVGVDGLTDYLIVRNNEILAEVTETHLVDQLPQAGTYTYSVTARYQQGQETGMPLSVEWNGTDVSENAIADNFVIGEAYPNPFNPEVSIPITVNASMEVKMAVYDVLGRNVATIQRQVGPGLHRMTWNGQSMAAGVYFIQVQAGNVKTMRKVVLMK